MKSTYDAIIAGGGVIGSAVAFGARVAQERFGVPLCSIVLSPFMMRSDHGTPVFRGWRLPDWMPRACKADRKSVV